MTGRSLEARPKRLTGGVTCWRSGASEWSRGLCTAASRRFRVTSYGYAAASGKATRSCGIIWVRTPMRNASDVGRQVAAAVMARELARPHTHAETTYPRSRSAQLLQPAAARGSASGWPPDCPAAGSMKPLSSLSGSASPTARFIAATCSRHAPTSRRAPMASGRRGYLRTGAPVRTGINLCLDDAGALRGFSKQGP